MRSAEEFLRFGLELVFASTLTLSQLGCEQVGLRRRCVRDARLFDVSAVTNPAYGNGATQVNARDFRSCDYGAVLQTQRFVQHILNTKPRVRIQPLNDVRVLAQIEDNNNRLRLRKIQRNIEARRIAAQYPELSLEHILHCRKLGYSEDLMVELRWAAIAEKIRTGRA